MAISLNSFSYPFKSGTCDLHWPTECGGSASASPEPKPQGALHAFICFLGTPPSCCVKKLGLSHWMKRDTWLSHPYHLDDS